MAELTKRTAEQLRSHLSSLSAEDLIDVVIAQATRDDDLRDRLLIDAVKRGADTVDLKSFQRSLNAAIFDLSERRYGAEYTSGEWAYGVNQAIGRLGELLAAGQAAAVVSLAEFALDALVEVMERADDSDGYISDLVTDLEGLHHDACLVAPPPPVELAGTLFTREVDGHWDVFVDAVSRYADVLGPKGIDRFRELGEKRWATVRPAGPGDRDHERWGANYRITRVMERLAELAGDVDAVVAVKSRDLSMPYDWLEVAEVYPRCRRARAFTESRFASTSARSGCRDGVSSRDGMTIEDSGQHDLSQPASGHGVHPGPLRARVHDDHRFVPALSQQREAVDR